MKIRNLIILLFIGPIFLFSCSDSASSDDKLVVNQLTEQDISKKDAKCILKETKPLVEKDLWSEYIGAVKKGGKVKDHLPMDKVMDLAFAFAEGSEKCGVPLLN
tara:strand:- start:30 stop:341 length:312 start_codon:yes stop_codon:yes gene_type:complete